MKFYCLDILIRWQGLLLMRKGKFQSSEIGNLFKSQTEIHWQETRPKTFMNIVASMLMDEAWTSIDKIDA